MFMTQGLYLTFLQLTIMFELLQFELTLIHDHNSKIFNINFFNVYYFENEKENEEEKSCNCIYLVVNFKSEFSTFHPIREILQSFHGDCSI